nr:T9SS type A sorting domain-containing protein [Saprospiraceae bacterium]
IDSLSNWLSPAEYRAVYQLVNNEEEYPAIALEVEGARDQAGNLQQPYTSPTLLDLDTQKPNPMEISANTYEIRNEHIGEAGLEISITFDEPMASDFQVELDFLANTPLEKILVLNEAESGWVSESTWISIYRVSDTSIAVQDIGIACFGGRDMAGNTMDSDTTYNFLSIDLIPSSTRDYLSSDGIKLYPNPAKEGSYFFFEHENYTRIQEVTIVNFRGQIMKRVVFNPHLAEATKVDVTGIPPGIYFLQVVDNKGQRSVKFTIF